MAELSSTNIYGNLKVTGKADVSGTVSAADPVDDSDLTTKEYVDNSLDGKVDSVGATAPITSTGGTSPTIGITAATTSVAGSMSAADKTKLNGVATGATANQTNAHLLNRANHTGTQAISTVTNLQSSLDGKVDANSSITAGTHPKITYDAKGLVTGGAALVAADIPNLATSKITSGSFTVARGGTGRSSLTSGSYLRGAGTSAVDLRTPAEVLGDIGAAPASHTHEVSQVSGLTVSPQEPDVMEIGDIWIDTSAEMRLHAYTEAVQVHTGVTGTRTLDFSMANVHDLTLSGNTTIAFSNLPLSNEAYFSITLVIRQPSTARTVTWPANFKWVGGAPSMAANSLWVVTLYS
jgi:hypothetical protein